MDSGESMDIVREAILLALTVGLPLIAVALIVGVLVSLFQTLTQIQDQTLNLVPKLIAMVIALVITLPWIADRLVEYTRTNFESIPARVGR